MKSTYFFRINWLIQLLVGMGLFMVSFSIQNQMIQTFLATPVLALALTLALETGKALSIIWHRYMTIHADKQVYPFITRMMSNLFRVGLVILSLLCSLLFLGNHLDRPQLEAVRSAELQTVQIALDKVLTQFQYKEAQHVSQLKQRQAQEYADLKQQHQSRIDVLQANLNKEMNNVVSGVFKGKRYLEFERLLENEKAQLAEALASLSQRHLQQTITLTQTVQQKVGQQRRAAKAKAEQQTALIIKHDYATDERVNDAHIVSFLKLTEAVFSLNVLPLQFVFAFSILLSLLMEIGIFLAFDTITITLFPVLNNQRRSSIDKDLDDVGIDMAREAEGNHQFHKSEIDGVAKRTKRTIEEAEALYDRFSDRSKW